MLIWRMSYIVKSHNLKFFSWNKDFKKAKIKKRAHAFKHYKHTYNVEILNFFYPKLQLKNTESAIKNKLKVSSMN